MHSAWATYYGGTRSIEQAKEAFKASVRGWYTQIESPTEEEDEEYASSLTLGLGMLDHYESFAKANDDFEVLFVERTFEVEIPGIEGAKYSLTPDGVVRDRFDRIWIIEHKTDKSIPENTDYLLMDEQCGRYILGLYLATGMWAEGVIYNIARKKVPQAMRVLKNGHLSVDKRCDTTYDYAVEQIANHYGDSAEAMTGMYDDFLDYLRHKGERFFLRESVRRNRKELEYLQEMIVAEAKEMLDPELPIYRNSSRFNCGNCPFVAPCISRYEGGDWESILEGNYVHREGRG